MAKEVLQVVKVTSIPMVLNIKNPLSPIFLEAGTSNTYVIEWELIKGDLQKQIEKYRTNWNYKTSDGKWYNGADNDVSPKVDYDKYTPPENAVEIAVQIKTVSKKYTVNKKQTKYFTDFITPSGVKGNFYKLYIGPGAGTPERPGEDKPTTPSVPTIRINGSKLEASVLHPDKNTKFMEFHFVTNGGLFDLGIRQAGLIEYVFYPKYGKDTIDATVEVNVSGYYETFIEITPGKTYNVQCRGVNITNPDPGVGGVATSQRNHFWGTRLEGDWSEWSDSDSGTVPPAWPTPLGSVMVGGSNIKAKAMTEDSVKVEWPIIPEGATEMTIEYSINKEYFDTTNQTQTLTVSSTAPYAIITGLTSGQEWFFRAKASNDSGSSGWSEIVSTTIGSVPASPTTWSSRSVVKVGEEVILYWTHNSKDGSDEKGAILTIRKYNANNEEISSDTINVNPPEKEGGINEYHYKSNNITEDTTVIWSVKTRGILSEYGEESAQRSFKVLTPAIAYLKMYKKSKWLWDPFHFPTDTIFTSPGVFEEEYGTNETVTKYPLYIVGFTEPKGHTPIDAFFTITSLQDYEALDSTGEEVWISAGQEVFSTSADLTKMEDTSTGKMLKIVLTPSDVYLLSGVSYNIHFSVSMANGLSTEADLVFTVDFPINVETLNAAISYDEDNVACYIRPYCMDEDGSIVKDVLMNIYRKDFDGKFVTIDEGLPSYINHTIIDPHPPLDYARYRLVGIKSETGTIFFYDIPAFPIPETAIIIQWDEKWKSFESSDEVSEMVEPNWTGSLLKLPYNIDVNDTTDVDTELIKYIGREHPVSYYGTQVEQKSNWKTDIPVYDKKTMYALRRLSRYMGDCYVREPNGSGYWAHLTINWSIEHRAMKIPITINIERVEGGM